MRNMDKIAAPRRRAVSLQRTICVLLLAVNVPVLAEVRDSVSRGTGFNGSDEIILYNRNDYMVRCMISWRVRENNFPEKSAVQDIGEYAALRTGVGGSLQQHSFRCFEHPEAARKREAKEQTEQRSREAAARDAQRRRQEAAIQAQETQAAQQRQRANNERAALEQNALARDKEVEKLALAQQQVSREREQQLRAVEEARLNALAAQQQALARADQQRRQEMLEQQRQSARTARQSAALAAIPAISGMLERSAAEREARELELAEEQSKLDALVRQTRLQVEQMKRENEAAVSRAHASADQYRDEVARRSSDSNANNLWADGSVKTCLEVDRQVSPTMFSHPLGTLLEERSKIYECTSTGAWAHRSATSDGKAAKAAQGRLLFVEGTK